YGEIGYAGKLCDELLQKITIPWTDLNLEVTRQSGSGSAQNLSDQLRVRYVSIPTQVKEVEMEIPSEDSARL
ncbi:hypothetical protein MKX01_037033, partial [Papaver californicum]